MGPKDDSGYSLMKKKRDKMIEDMIKYTIDSYEGGYVDHPDDRGGPTKYGITKRVYERWLGRSVSKDEMRNMPLENAVNIYKEEYFIQPKVQDLPLLLQHVTFDMCVNHGQRQGVKILQTALQSFPEGVNLTLDGRIGPQTVRAAVKTIARHGPSEVLAAIVAERRKFYHAIIANDPSQEKFQGGWFKRADAFLKEDLISSSRKVERFADKITDRKRSKV